MDDHEIAGGLGPRERVLAVVVAFNTLDSVIRCLTSLHAQTVPVDVLVVDNSDPSPLSIDLESLGFDRARVIWAAENLGPAGGFAFGLAWFMESGQYTHAWLMDDDCYPDPTALELLVEAAAVTRPGAALFPSAVYEATGVAMNYPGWSGVLIDRLAVRLAGLPRAEMFWWAEDTEYLQFRLPRKGVQVVRVDQARVLYDLIRRVGGRPAWKYYYEVRNMVWFRLSEQKGSELYKLPRTMVRMLGSALVSDGRGAKTRMYFTGLAHGLVGRLGRGVRPPNQPPARGTEAEQHAD